MRPSMPPTRSRATSAANAAARWDAERVPTAYSRTRHWNTPRSINGWGRGLVPVTARSPRPLPPTGPRASDPGRTARPFADSDSGVGRTLAVVGVYRFLATGEDTNGKYAVCETLVGPGGGPAPHVH